MPFIFRPGKFQIGSCSGGAVQNAALENALTAVSPLQEIKLQGLNFLQIWSQLEKCNKCAFCERVATVRLI